MTKASKLKLKRIESGLTQTQLKEKAGVGMNTIVALEKGNVDSTKLLLLKKIAVALNTTVQELFLNE